MNTFNSETHQYFMKGREVLSVTTILKAVGLIDDQWYTEEGRLRGQAVHLATEYLDQNDLDWDGLDSSLIPYVKAYQKFKVDSGFVPELIEQRVYNALHFYAGTLDRTGKFKDGSPALVDLKSGAVASWAALQTAAYEFALPERRQRFAVQLKKDGTYKLHVFKDPNDIKFFLSAAAVANWKLSHGGVR